MAPFGILPEPVIRAWPKLSPSAKAVTGALAGFMNGNGECWPSVPAIKAASGIKKDQTIADAISELKEKDIVVETWRAWRKRVLSWAKLPLNGIKDNSETAADGHKGSSETAAKRQTKLPPNGSGNNTINNITALCEVPGFLKGLELYRVDAKLCKQWPSLVAAWDAAYSDRDIGSEIKKAHAWEIANPSKRKKDRGKFLTGWLSRATPKAKSFDPTDVPEPTPAQKKLIGEANRAAAELERKRGKSE